MSRLLTAQHHEQVGDHHGLAFLVEFDDDLVLKALQGEADHAYRAFHDAAPRADDRAGLLLAQHGLGDLRPITKRSTTQHQQGSLIEIPALSAKAATSPPLA